MHDPRTQPRPRARRTKRALTIAAASTLLLVVTACSGDDDATGASGNAPDDQAIAELLGPDDAAAGEPVKIGMVSDGTTVAYDAADELRAAAATAEYWNTHRGGIGGRPIEVVTCETGGDPAGATDCGNQMVEQDVVAVAQSQSAVGDSLWEPVRDGDREPEQGGERVEDGERRLVVDEGALAAGLEEHRRDPGGVAMGATDDPTYQLYQAVMATYGDDVNHVDDPTAMGGYTAMAALATALDGITGDITPETVTATIKAMPQQDLPGGGGVTYQCSGTISTLLPAVCTNEWLQTSLDTDGQPTTYERIDSTDILPQ